MPVDPIIHCLQELSDYDAFERLCSAIMDGIGYQNIEPLGGKSDKGRDALFHSRSEEETTIFAYTVRQDWKQKLNQDCETIRKNQHDLDHLVFVCTSSITATQKDKIKAEVLADFGWRIEIYDLERLRVLLASSLRHLIPKHPQIFCWPYFDVRGGVSTAFGRDLVVIDHCDDDHAFAAWLTRRLQVEGYSVWCFGLAPMAGESSDETVRELIANRAIRYLPVLSPTSCSDSDFMARVSLAVAVDRLALPLRLNDISQFQLPSKVSALQVANFDQGWAAGLRQLLLQFESHRLPKRYSTERGEEIALASFVPTQVTTGSPETIYTNTFEVTLLPRDIHVYASYRALKREELDELSQTWSFSVLTGRLFASFHEPPSLFSLSHKYDIRVSLDENNEIEGRKTNDIVKELVRGCLELKCRERELEWCSDRGLFYFPSGDGGPQRSVPLKNPNGKTTSVHVTGFRQWGFGEKATKFFYQLAPLFRVTIDSLGNVWVQLRIYVRVTQSDGSMFEGKAIGKRRKKVTKSWWNNHFFARLLGVIQYLANGADEIVVGENEQQVRISTTPHTWDCPISIDEEAVAKVGDFHEELAEINARNWTDDEDDDTAGESDS